MVAYTDYWQIRAMLCKMVRDGMISNHDMSEEMSRVFYALMASE